MKLSLRKLGADAIKVLLVASAGVVSTATVFAIGMMTPGNVVSRVLYAKVEPGLIGRIVTAVRTAKDAR